MINLWGYLVDCEEFEEICEYACDKQDVLRQFLDLPCGIPSYDTAPAAWPESVVSSACSPSVRSAVDQLGQTHCGCIGPKQLIVDSKQLRGTVEAGHKQATVQIVSVRAEGERLCVAQRQITAKTREIKAIAC